MVKYQNIHSSNTTYFDIAITTNMNYISNNKLNCLRFKYFINHISAVL